MRARHSLAAFGCLLCSATCAGAALASAAGPISPPFVKKADKVCAGIDAKFQHALGNFPYPNFDPAKPDRKTLVLVGKHFAKALPIRKAIPSLLKGLGEPASGRASWDAIRSLALEDNAVATTQVSAALAGDTKAFVATYRRLIRIHGSLVEKAAAAGFPKRSACSDAF